MAETTTVAKRDYVSPAIVAGFSGTLTSPNFARRAPAVTIRMPAIGLRAPVMPKGVSHERMTLPANVGAVGWLRKPPVSATSAPLSSPAMSNTDDNPGALYRLRRAHTGQQIAVAGAGRRAVQGRRQEPSTVATPSHPILRHNRGPPPGAHQLY